MKVSPIIILHVVVATACSSHSPAALPATDPVAATVVNIEVTGNDVDKARGDVIWALRAYPGVSQLETGNQYTVNIVRNPESRLIGCGYQVVVTSANGQSLGDADYWLTNDGDFTDECRITRRQAISYAIQLIVLDATTPGPDVDVIPPGKAWVCTERGEYLVGDIIKPATGSCWRAKEDCAEMHEKLREGIPESVFIQDCQEQPNAACFTSFWVIQSSQVPNCMPSISMCNDWSEYYRNDSSMSQDFKSVSKCAVIGGI